MAQRVQVLLVDDVDGGVVGRRLGIDGGRAPRIAQVLPHDVAPAAGESSA